MSPSKKRLTLNSRQLHFYVMTSDVILRAKCVSKKMELAVEHGASWERSCPLVVTSLQAVTDPQAPVLLAWEQEGESW